MTHSFDQGAHENYINDFSEDFVQDELAILAPSS